MDPVSLLSLFGLALTGGGIALFADWLGRHLGKKKKRLFSLRPRHTARLLTFTAGFVIPISAVLLVMAASSDVRSWLVEGRQIASQNRILKQEQETIQHQKTEAQTELTRRTSDLKLRSSELQKAIEQTVKAKGDIERYRSEATRLVQTAKRLSSTISDLRTKADQQSNLLIASKRDLESSKKEIDSNNRALSGLRSERDELIRQESQLIRENTQLDKDNKKFASQLTDLESKIKEKAAIEMGLTKANADLAAVVSARQSALEQTEALLSQAKSDLDVANRSLQTANMALEASLDASRRRPMIFRQGQELGRLTNPPSVNLVEARALLQNLLKSARTVAADAGGAPSSQGSRPVAGIWPLQGDSGHLFSVEEQEAQIVNSIKVNNEFLVLVATATWNVFEGEPVPLDIRAYRNPIVFKKDAIIAETRIDGRQDDDAIVKAIDRFLTTNVKQRAVTNKMIPVNGRPNSYGSVNSDEILALLKLIKEANRDVRVVAFAPDDIRAADELRVKFRTY